MTPPPRGSRALYTSCGRAAATSSAAGVGQAGPAEFPMLDQLRREGQTDYLAFVHRFAGEGAIGGMDCVYSSWSTAHPRASGRQI